MIKPASLVKQRSSGGVIFRKSGEKYEIALVTVKKGKVWCLPKGLVDSGETPEITAIREVREETGLTGRIIEKIGEINYWYYIKEENLKCRKTVFFFLMEYLSGDTADHDYEVDSAEWFDLNTAMQRISYKGDRTIIEKAIEKLRHM